MTNPQPKSPATPEQREECIRLYKKVHEVIHGQDIDNILNTLCFIVADVGTELEMDKKTFIASVVEQVSSAYDACIHNEERH